MAFELSSEEPELAAGAAAPVWAALAVAAASPAPGVSTTGAAVVRGADASAAPATD
ncbi:Uncharacterised protein [Mycobacterium tuberculosis]|nr:Uncharacterised protein [Mycobacterium tuberculosis]